MESPSNRSPKRTSGGSGSGALFKRFVPWPGDRAGFARNRSASGKPMRSRDTLCRERYGIQATQLAVSFIASSGRSFGGGSDGTIDCTRAPRFSRIVVERVALNALMGANRGPTSSALGLPAVTLAKAGATRSTTVAKLTVFAVGVALSVMVLGRATANSDPKRLKRSATQSRPTCPLMGPSDPSGRPSPTSPP